MGWLEDRLVQHLYSNGTEEIVIETKASEDPPPPPKGFKYKGFLPDKHVFMTKVQFERNGRVGYSINVGSGSKPFSRSATRERYEHMVGNTGAEAHKRAKASGESIDYNKSVYTKPYQEFVEKRNKEKVRTAETKLKKIMKKGE